jgi:hypothetical protein
MSFQGKFLGRVVSRDRARPLIDGSYFDEIVLAIQVVSGDGLEKGKVYVRSFNRKDSGGMFNTILLLKPGHMLTVPFDKEPGKNVQIHREQIVVKTAQFAKDWENAQPADPLELPSSAVSP